MDLGWLSQKSLLITGGTGTFGNAVVERAAQIGVREIRIFSRDEKKQDEMRARLKNHTSKSSATRKCGTKWNR